MAKKLYGLSPRSFYGCFCIFSEFEWTQILKYLFFNGLISESLFRTGLNANNEKWMMSEPELKDLADRLIAKLNKFDEKYEEKIQELKIPQIEKDDPAWKLDEQVKKIDPTAHREEFETPESFFEGLSRFCLFLLDCGGFELGLTMDLVLAFKMKCVNDVCSLRATKIFASYPFCDFHYDEQQQNKQIVGDYLCLRHENK